MKKKNILFILLIIIGCLIILAPNVNATYYFEFRTNSNLWTNFFKHRFERYGNQTYIRYSPSELKEEDPCGDSCPYCKKNTSDYNYTKLCYDKKKNINGENKIQDGYVNGDYPHYMIHFSNIWCASHKSLDKDNATTYNLDEIIDLSMNTKTGNANYKFNSKKGNAAAVDATREIDKAAIARMAYLCYFSTDYLDERPAEFKYDGTGAYNKEYDNSSGLFFEAQYQVWYGSWKEFYDQILKKSKIRKLLDLYKPVSDTNASYLSNKYTYNDEENHGTKQRNYINYVKEKVKLKVNKQTQPQLQVGNYDDKCKTKIGPYKINQNYDLTDTGYVDVTIKVNGKNKNGILKKDTNGQTYIYLKEKITSINSLKITEQYTYYKARLMLFSGESNQTRTIVKGEEKNYSDTITLTNPTPVTDISIEKIVYSYNGKKVPDRSNQKAGVTGANGKITKGVDVKQSQKKSDPVQNDKIKENTWITYKIKLYNNSEIAAKVNIEDVLPTGAEYYYWSKYNASTKGRKVSERNFNQKKY